METMATIKMHSTAFKHLWIAKIGNILDLLNCITKVSLKIYTFSMMDFTILTFPSQWKFLFQGILYLKALVYFSKKPIFPLL